MSNRGAKSKVTLAGHTLTYAELAVLNQVKDYMRKRFDAGNGTALAVPLNEIFSGNGQGSNAKRYAARRLASLGVFAACQIDFDGDVLKILSRS